MTVYAYDDWRSDLINCIKASECGEALAPIFIPSLVTSGRFTDTFELLTLSSFFFLFLGDRHMEILAL
jgi:hypothetical protein